MNKNIFRTYDIRGIAISKDKDEIDLTKENTYLLGKAIASFLKRKYFYKNIAIGGDCRLTTPKLKESLIKGFLDSGFEVTDIGLSTSPLLYWTVATQNFDAGINVTASHNPKEYNGFKILGKNACSIFGDEIQEIYSYLKSKNFLKPNEIEKINKLTTKDFSEDYIQDIKNKIKTKRKLKVVIDSGNGTSGPFAGKLFKLLGHEVIELFETPDGNFPNHEANPEKRENMLALIDKVLESQSDIGIAFDGDGDRVGIVDEKGNTYAADFLLYLLSKDLISRHPKAKVVFDTKFSQAIINEMKKIGLDTIMYKTGHSLIKKKMKETQALLAGEVSGHMFFAENYYGFDDAIYAAAKITEILAKEKNPLSEIFSIIKKTISTEEIKAKCPDDKKFEIVEKIKNTFNSQYDCILIDGVRIKFSDTDWALVRASNTSPNLTLRFEAKTEENLREMQKIVFEECSKYPEINNDWYKN